MGDLTRLGFDGGSEMSGDVLGERGSGVVGLGGGGGERSVVERGRCLGSGMVGSSEGSWGNDVGFVYCVEFGSVRVEFGSCV